MNNIELEHVLKLMVLISIKDTHDIGGYTKSPLSDDEFLTSHFEQTAIFVAF